MAKRKLSYELHLALLKDVSSKKYKHLNLYVKYNISKAAFNNYLKVTPEKYRNYKDKNLVHSYFDKIDTEEKAYFLGLLFADGSIRKTNAMQHYITLCSISTDSYIVDRLITEVKSILPMRIEHRDNTVRCQFSSKQMYQTLLSYGMAPHTKFGRRIPKIIPKRLMHHFFRGIFDGDGCISTTKKYSITRVEFIASKFLLKFLMKTLKISHTIYMKGSISYVQFGKKAHLLKIYKYLYSDSTIYLTRKFDKFKIFTNS